ncbi:Zinc transporter ZupT [Pandoraea anapnoica]|uniref:Zinc transporter ZupT n=1 Tax=Pandoraea anapnoica TaxID=2508301 RepID=A0A5E5AT93_9BURK|nr:Zinc transporter ZupT [Pandoraea anapnoica]
MCQWFACNGKSWLNRRLARGRITIDAIFLFIVIATLASGVLSLFGAASLSLGLLSKLIDKMVSFSAGVLLGTALLHLLPESLESHVDAHVITRWLLGGLLGFFLLEKLALLRHSHHHEGDGHHHEHGHDAHEAGKGGWMILVGSAIHNFADGVVIAAAFLTDPRLGVAATVSITVHEVAHKLGDFMVLLNAGFKRRKALVLTLASSLTALLGGVLGYFMLDRLQSLIPYLLALAASSFIYIAVSDLMPQMQRRTSPRDALPQILLIGVGLALVVWLNGHDHDHDHGHGHDEGGSALAMSASVVKPSSE